MSNVGYATLQVIPSMKGIKTTIERGLGEADGGAAGAAVGGRFGDGFKKVALAAGGLVAAKIGTEFFTGAIGSASDLAETVSKANTIFGSAAGGIESWANRADTALGQSKQQALDAAATFGNMFTQLGIGQGAAAAMSTEMVKLGSDFASFHNDDISTVLQAQTAAFRGEFDAVQRYVPTINAAAVEQKAMALGLAASSKELTNQDKALATQQLLLEGAGAATGDFARTSDGLANKQRILSARFENIKAKIGGALLPVVTSLTGALADGLGPGLETVSSALRPLGNAAKQVLGILFEGDFKGGGPFSEDSPIVDTLFDIREAIQGIDLGAIFTGVAEKVTPVATAVGQIALAAFDFGRSALPVILGAVQAALPPLSTALDVVITAVGLLGDHANILMPLLALLAGGFVALKTAAAINKTFDTAVKSIQSVRDAASGAVSTVQRLGYNLKFAADKAKNVGASVLDSGKAVARFAKSAAVATGKVIAQTAAWVAQKAVLVATTVAQKAMTVAQWALNAAMSANPLLLIVAGLAALVAGLVIAYQKVGWFRDLVDGAFRLIKTVIMGAFNWVKDNWPLLLAILTGPIGLAVLAITKNWDTIKDGITKVKDWIGDRVTDIVNFFTGLPGKIAAIAGGMWDGISGAFINMINRIIGVWNGLDFTLPEVEVFGVKLGGQTIGLPDIDPIGATGKPLNLKVSGSLGKIVKMASGGIAKHRPGGILANIAEARTDEVVAPLTAAGLRPFAEALAPTDSGAGMAVDLKVGVDPSGGEGAFFRWLIRALRLNGAIRREMKEAIAA